MARAERARKAKLRAGESRSLEPFFVVGVGASAGGLAALGALVSRIDFDKMAFVVIQHLSPRHASVLAELLSRSSRIQVSTAEDGDRVERNHIYVIPPNANLAIMQGVLHVLPRAAESPHLPIDYFLRSLADDQGNRAIGVVLSGTGSDGTFGLKAIKEAGGITLVQDPATAKYASMPEHAIQSGWADVILPPEKIGDELMEIGRHPYLAKAHASHKEPGNTQRLLLLIRQAFGNDLSLYKTATIERRIARRMALHKIEQLEPYIDYVESHPEELKILYKDMLINVTSFFRDPESFEVLTSKLIPRMLEHKAKGAAIRIWIPACASGEEAYSVAICLLETLGDRASDFRIQIFATDVDDHSIQAARRAVYPANIALDVSADRLRRFFVKKDNGFQVARSVRDLVVFSTHNLNKDAPFSRVDLVSCRNLLIYLQPAAQKKVLRVFHYALNPTGFLLLAPSETVGDASDLFSLSERKHKVYTPKHLSSVASLEMNLPSHAVDPPASLQPGGAMRPLVNLASLADRKILEMYGPAGVVINEDLDILHFRGRTGPYLEPAPGTASLGILRLARPELHADLRRTIQQALRENVSVSCDSMVLQDHKSKPFHLQVVPILEPETKARCLLVLFHELSPSQEAPPPAALPSTPQDQRVQELERELLVTREYLQTTIEELQSANEELKSSNEELQSSNEELQSTNEELETSKEELQSSNEELSSVNDELQTRMTELQLTNDDLNNVMRGVETTVIITGMDLRIRRFTHAAEKILDLVAGDVGRHVSQLNAFVMGERVEQLAAEVLKTLVPLQRDVRCADDHWYALRITPYKTVEHAITGVVVVLADIEGRAKETPLPLDAGRSAAGFLDIVASALMIVDSERHVVWANAVLQKRFGVDPVAIVGQTLATVMDGAFADERLAALLDATLNTGGIFRDFHPAHAHFRISASRIPASDAKGARILLSLEMDNDSP